VRKGALRLGPKSTFLEGGFLIDYRALTDRSDFTFSFKIVLLKSLRLIPSNIVNMCDCVRKVRNEFAHNLEIDKIESVKSEIKIKLINYILRIQTKKLRWF